MSEIYPKFTLGRSPEVVYYVEFNRGRSDKNTFTLFRRYIFEEREGMPQDIFYTLEGHPYQLFTSTHGPEGGIPDKEWVKWMVDSLNKVSR